MKGKNTIFHDAVWADKQKETASPVYLFYFEQDGSLFSQVSLVL